MKRLYYKFPKVFVACPYNEEIFGYTEFKKMLESLPIACEFADTTLETKHLLEKISLMIERSEYAFFDLSMWNPNVSLELGLAHGLDHDNYYIFVNERLDTEVPSDIKGIQRIQYSSSTTGDKSLQDQLIRYFFKEIFKPTQILWKKVYGCKNPNKIYKFCLRILTFLREHEIIGKVNYKELAKGLRIREPDREKAITILHNIGFLRKIRRKEEYKLNQEKKVKTRQEQPLKSMVGKWQVTYGPPEGRGSEIAVVDFNGKYFVNNRHCFNLKNWKYDRSKDEISYEKVQPDGVIKSREILRIINKNLLSGYKKDHPKHFLEYKRVLK